MTELTQRPAASTEPSPTARVLVGDRAPRQRARRGRRWIEHWEPENAAFWAHSGRRIARRNLVVSVFAEHIGFSIWTLWTVVVLSLGNAGFQLTIAQQFWLTAVPNLVGSALRIPYTFAVPRFGGRLWTTLSAGLLFIPATLLAVVVPSGWLAARPSGVQFWVLLACAATAGLGGGNFSSSMANISFFYPEGKKGAALGINAAGGNLGVAVAQLVVPLVLIVGVPATAARLPKHPVHLAYAGIVWLPLIALAMFAAWWRMDSLVQARSDGAAYVAALRQRHTWVMSLLYIGTFGSFIGYSFALPLVIKNTFPEFLGHHPLIATYLAGLAFTGALVGSLARPLGGWLSDRAGGARVTAAAFVGLAACTVVAIVAVEQHGFPLFFAAFVGVFFLAGTGNGSTYRMIPSIFAELGREHAVRTGAPLGPAALTFKRQAAAVIGVAGAVGAFGGFLVQVVIRHSSLHVSMLMGAASGPAQKAAIAHAHSTWVAPALAAFVAAYVGLTALTWGCYLRPGRRLGGAH